MDFLLQITASDQTRVVIEDVQINFSGMLSELGSAIIIIPIIAILESIAIAKAFCKLK